MIRSSYQESGLHSERAMMNVVRARLRDPNARSRRTDSAPNTADKEQQARRRQELLATSISVVVIKILK